MNPFVRLFKDSKFWLLVLDTIISLTLYFTAKYLAPELADDVKFLIAALQPVFVAIILAILGEDAAMLRAGIHPSQTGR